MDASKSSRMESEPLTPEREVVFTPPEEATGKSRYELKVGDVVRSSQPDAYRGVICSMHEDGRMQVKDYTGSTLYTNRNLSTLERVPYQEQLALERYLSLVLCSEGDEDPRTLLMAVLPPDVWNEMWEDYPNDVMQALGLLARYMSLVEVMIKDHLPGRPVNSLTSLKALEEKLRGLPRPPITRHGTPQGN